MRRIICILLAVCTLAALITGCDFWMNGERVFVEPYEDQNEQPQTTTIQVSSLDQLKRALVDAVHKLATDCTISTSTISQERLQPYMDAVIDHIMKKDAFGAYAVSEITYDVGLSGGNAAIAVDIAYHHSKTEMMQVKQVENMESANALITQALDACEAGIVFCVQEYEETDFAQFVADYGYENPDVVIEIPQVLAAVYPETGFERVVELIFTYQTSREELRAMQDSVEPVFTSAELYVSGSEDQKKKFEQLYSFLMERYEYTVETSITPSYSLLCHGVGDCRAFANVYAAMCRKAGLDCKVISGTKNAEAWFWNMVQIDGSYYYVDLLRSSTSGGFRLLKDSEMSGYVWNYSAHPAAV